MKVRDPLAVRRFRKRADLNQAQLAVLCGCTQQMISHIESGKRTTITEALALALVRRLKCDWEDLFDAHGDTRMPASAIRGNTHHAKRRQSA